MARGFGATLGAGTTDIVTSALTTHAATRSWSIWVLRNGEGGSSAGRIFRKGAGGTIELTNSGTTYRFIVGFSGGSGSGVWTIPRPVTGSFFHLVVTYNNSSTANDPVMYLDGVSQTVTEVTTPVGTALTADTETWSIGNRPDGLRVWDGELAEFAIWNRILDQGDVDDLFAEISPKAQATNLVEYLPMLEADDPIISCIIADPTVVGTVATTHPFASLGCHSELAADAGSYAITGTAAALQVTRIFNAEAGSYALTGTAAALQVTRIFSAEAGSYALTGMDAELTHTPVGGGSSGATTHYYYTRKRRR